MKKTADFLWNTTKGFRLMFAGLFITVLVTALTGASFSMVIGKLVDVIWYDRNFRLFFLYFGLYAGLYLVNLSFHGGLNYLWAKLKVIYLADIRRRLYAHLLHTDSGTLLQMRSGDVMKRLDEDVECILEFLHRCCFYVIENGIQILAALVYLMSASKILGAAGLVIAPLTAWSSLYFTGLLQKKRRELEDGRGRLLAWLMEMLGGMEELKLLSAGRRISAEFERRTRRLTGEECSLDYRELGLERLNSLILLLGKLAVLGCSAWLVKRGNISVGMLVAGISYYDSCVKFLQAINIKLNLAAGRLAGIHRVQEIFDLPLEEQNPGLQNQEKSVELKNVCFSYSQEKQILRKVSFLVKPGEHVALVGKSGEGKSTILQLLYRLYDTDSGQILIGEHPIGEYDRQHLRARMGIVMQQPVLLRKSIRYNICLTSETGEQWEDQRLWELLEALKLRERIEALPRGLDTVLGQDYDEKGLSGGERQRLVIARALWKKPDIILLDEATNALDEQTEKAVNQAVFQWAENATIIYAAHRPATIRQADRIIMLQNGSAMELA